MAMIASWLKIDEERVVEGLQDAGRKLDGLEREVALDFSSVRRIDPSVVRALEELAGIAEDKGVKIALRGLNVDVYKVLKLVKLASRFTFVN
ncbi:MAG: STAS domain-containing protein [Terriglobales bacterium]